MKPTRILVNGSESLAGQAIAPDGGKSCSRYDKFELYGYGVRKKCVGSNGRLSGKLSNAISKLTELRVFFNAL